ncbi:desmoglein-2-like isoform X1 [Perca fluviatilis]|uniref:desmoglein-2-like isoform X1 n=1 Tax=Perca fluviatilis TaxID=8168 RepID=UPI00196513E8|nr:desmoglein-2-like isoform X1 [Perca fluviatilis]
MTRVSPAVCVWLLFGLQAVAAVKAHCFLVPPKKLMENVDYTKQEHVARIHSDFDDGNGNIVYSLEGKGANQNPFNVFVVNPRSGHIRVTKILDREFMDSYMLTIVTRYKNGSLAESNFDLRVQVVDDNDNSPVFQDIQTGVVNEGSPVGTTVMRVIATDDDERGNRNSQIAYHIIDQTPAHDMFEMSKSGYILVKNSGLDREKTDQYVLTVRGQDLNGEPGGNTGTGTVTIDILDVNDNCPVLTTDFHTMCTTDVSVIVNAEDKDSYPNRPPFDFVIIPEGTQGKWQVNPLNDTAASLNAQESMWPGFYEVKFVVRDKQGEACPDPQKVTVEVCTCVDGVVCGKRATSKKSEFGPLGIGLLVLGLLLLLRKYDVMLILMKWAKTFYTFAVLTTITRQVEFSRSPV